MHSRACFPCTLFHVSEVSTPGSCQPSLILVSFSVFSLGPPGSKAGRCGCRQVSLIAARKGARLVIVLVFMHTARRNCNNGALYILRMIPARYARKAMDHRTGIRTRGNSPSRMQSSLTGQGSLTGLSWAVLWNPEAQPLNRASTSRTCQYALVRSQIASFHS